MAELAGPWKAKNMFPNRANLVHWLKNFEQNPYFLEYLNLSRYELAELGKYCNDQIREIRSELRELELHNNTQRGYFNNPWFETLQSALAETQRLEGKLNATELAKAEPQPKYLSARTVAAIIWALNKCQPQTITKHKDGIKKGLENFAIPTQCQASTVHKHVKVTGNGSKNDPLQSTNLAKAGDWLENNGYNEAANRAFELLAEQRYE